MKGIGVYFLKKFVSALKAKLALPHVIRPHKTLIVDLFQKAFAGFMITYQGIKKAGGTEFIFKKSRTKKVFL